MTLLGKIALLVLIVIIHKYWSVPAAAVTDEVWITFWMSLAVFLFDNKK